MLIPPLASFNTFSYYSNQKKNLELNPRHPLIKELKNRVESKPDDQTTKDLAMVLLETATLRSGFALKETAGFADRIERMLRLSVDISLDEKVGGVGGLRGGLSVVS